MPVLPSPSTRRSPRSEKLRGLHSAPPSKKAVVAAAAPSREEDASAAASDATTTTAAAKAPLLPPRASTPGRRGGKIGSPGCGPKGAPLLVSPWRRTTFISPRTRGAAIVGALSSPGDLGSGAAFLSPSRRSSAEAALHYLARETAEGGGNDDGDRIASLAPRNGRRRRKAASDASDRLRDICDLDEFDDLDRLLEEDKIPYNKPAAARRGRGEGGKDAVTKSTTDDVATVGSFVTRGKNDERWLRNFQTWTTSKGGGGRRSTTSLDERSSAIPPGAPIPPSSPLLPKGWVRDQRAQYRALTRGERSAMTRDRVALLEGAVFVWEARNGRGGSSLADDGKLHDVQSGDAGEMAATIHATVGQKHERKDGKMGKRSKSEATRGTSSSDVIEDNAQRSDARGTFTTVQHATEGQSERKDGRIRNSAKSGPTTQSAGGEPGRSIINGESPGRKSPRKSPPTQFYHSLLLGNWSEVGGGASSGGRSFDPTTSNDEGRSSLMIPNPGVSSDHASPTAASKKRKRSSPSKRTTSPSFREGSLTSLPPSDVVAEDGSDKRGERRKKKRRRGRNSTSSLFALEPPVEASTEGGGEVDSVRKGPAVSFLSHRELEEVLSKSRKNRSRKKSGGGVPKGKIPVEPTTSIAGAVPIDANKSSSEDSKLVDEPSRGEVGAEIEDSKGGHDASIESPLRVTRLLPALMGVDAVDGGTIGATAVSYMTGEGATDVPCIAQLLLSCLSEDSAEEAAHSSALSGPKSMTDEVVSVNVVSCEMNRDGPGGSPSLPFTSKPPEESISRLDPSSDNGASAAQIESSKSESKQQTIARPKPSARNSKPPEDFLTLNSTSGEMPHRKKKTEKEESSKNTEVPFECSRQGVSTKNSNAEVDEMRLVNTVVTPKNASGINSSHEPEDSVGRLANCTLWTCDICKAATFEDYFDAVAHEEECAIANKVQEKTPSNKKGEVESNVSGDRLRRKSSLVETKKFQAIAAAKAPRESRLDPLSDKSHDGTCAAQVESNLVLNGVVFQNGILNYSFPAGEQIRESQLQMIIPESGYLERMADLGRLQLETQMVTRRMQQIEDMMKLSSKISHVGAIEGRGSMSRKRSYLKESKSTSIHHHTHSWSCHNESSNEEYSDGFHSPRKMRRQKRAQDEVESRMISTKHSRRRLEILKGSPTKMNGRSISSRHGGMMTHLRYDDFEIEMRRSQISKKVEGYGADCSLSPKRHHKRVDELHHAPRSKKRAKMYHAPRNKKRSKSYNTEPLVAKVPSTSGSRKTKSKQMLRSDVEKLSPHKLVSHQSDEYFREESHPHTVTSSSKLQKWSEKKSGSPPIKTSAKPNVEADAKYSDKASSEQSPGEAKGKGVIPARSSQYQVNETRDPIYWLAGGESSSDDESWDFDGPMILPPSPI